MEWSHGTGIVASKGEMFPDSRPAILEPSDVEESYRKVKNGENSIIVVLFPVLILYWK